MIRTVLAVAALAAGLTAAIAQDVIADRKALMKRSGGEARAGAAMVRGEQPFDLAKAKHVFETYLDKAQKLPNLFPPTSKTGDTNATAAIWDKPDAWKAAIAKFEADAKAALAATTDLDSFKAQFAAVGRDCAGCHETFKKS